MQRASSSYTFGRFHLDSNERRLLRNGQSIPLTPKAFDTLLTLVQHSGHALTKDELMRAVWPDGFVEEVNLAYNISILRKALADGRPGEQYIETVPKLGYRFVMPVQAKGLPQSPSPAHSTVDGTFGDLLSRHLHRKHGLSQSKLAAGILQSPAVISKMCKGQRLTGPQASERVLAIIGWLRQQGALETVAEANALLSAAGMASLRQGEPSEFALIRQLHAHPSATAPAAAITPAVRRTNLPAQLTRFIGRERELAEVTSAVAVQRLVTLTGAAGMGKTRLALEAGVSVLDQFPDGAWLVELAPLADGSLVPTTVASAFDLSEQLGRSMADALVAFIAEKPMLVILDNCEHVIEASARLAETLLRACPRLHIQATSREALRLPGEVIWRTPPLSMPELANLPPLERMAEYDAVQLFVEHTALTQPGFTLTPANLPAVAQICQRLDGMPLAIEMAAAQVPDMGLAGVASGLDDRFALLTNGSRTAVPRHQTLRATLDWSYTLLSEPERALLARLSVFAGGWTADAAQAVCESTHQTLLQLARKSLVMTVVSERDGQPRYRLLETIRHYAAEKLRERGERDATLDRHLDYFLDMAEEPVELAGPRVNPWVRRMDFELDNVRAAFAWAMKRDDKGESALRLADAMRTYSSNRGHLAELGTWADQAWSRGDKAPTYARARGLLAKASVCCMTGGKIPGIRLCEEALALLRQTDDRVHLAGCLEMLANNAFDDRVPAYAEEALPLFREFGSKDGEGRILRALGTVALRAGDHARAAQLLEQAIELAPWDATACFTHLYKADPKRALTLCAQKHMHIAPSHDPEHVAVMLGAYGFMLMVEGDYAHARRVLEQSVRARQPIDTGQPFDLVLLTLPLPLDTTGLSLKGCGADVFCISVVFLHLGLTEYILGRHDYAHARLDQGRAFASEAGVIWLEIVADFLKTSVKITEGHLDNAMRRVTECLRRFNQADSQLGAACALVQIAGLNGHNSDWKRACKLLGVVEARMPEADPMAHHFMRIPSLWLPHAKEAIITPTLAAARAELGDAEFEAAYADGQRMTLDEAVAYALSDK